MGRSKIDLIEITAQISSFLIGVFILSWLIPYLRKKEIVDKYLIKIGLISFLTYSFIWVSWFFLIFVTGIPAWIDNLPSGLIHYLLLVANVGSIFYFIHLLKKQW